MLKRTRAVIGGLIAVLVLPLLAVSPASADHGNFNGHWRNGVYPIVTTPFCASNGCDLIQDASYFWQDRGFSRGYTPPLPRTGYDCEPNWNEISVCFVNLGDPLRARPEPSRRWPPRADNSQRPQVLGPDRGGEVGDRRALPAWRGEPGSYTRACVHRRAAERSQAARLSA